MATEASIVLFAMFTYTHSVIQLVDIKERCQSRQEDAQNSSTLNFLLECRPSVMLIRLSVCLEMYRLRPNRVKIDLNLCV